MTCKHKLSARLALLKDLSLVIPVLGLCGCEKPAGLADPGRTVARVAVSPRQIALLPNQTSHFLAVGLTATGDTTSVAVTWRATGGTIIDTSSTGSYHYATYQPSAIPGKYLVIATDPPDPGFADTSTITVLSLPVASVTLNPSVASIVLGATVQLAAIPQDASGTPLDGRSVNWASSAPGVATVSATGLVTAVLAGSATITATSEGKSGTAAITVTTVPVASVTVSPASASVRVGGTQQVLAVVKDSAGGLLTGRVVVWSSGNTSVATVSSSGLVTGVTAGATTVTAASEGKSTSATITVTNLPVDTVTVSPASATIAIGGTQQLSAVTKDSAGRTLTGRVVNWSSSSASVASVSGGLVTGQSAGSVTITATSEGKSGTSVIRVQPPLPTSHAGYYVAPNGLPTGDGSSTRPWDLATALARPLAVQPGDTIWLRGGTYTGSFISQLVGTPGAPIVVRQYPGERATVDGNFVMFGSDTWFWGFEVMRSGPTVGGPNGIMNRGARLRYINMVIHDASGVGVGLFDNTPVNDAPDCEIYGSLVYNNGTVNNLNHGIYIYNHVGGKKVRDNIVFNNWSLGIQAYAQSAVPEWLNNITIDGNIAFNNGSISGYAGGPVDIFLGAGDVSAVGAVITNNYAYRNNSQRTIDAGYYYSAGHRDLVFTGNYAYGLVQFFRWATATVRNNTVYSKSPYGSNIAGQVEVTGSVAGYAMNANTWYGDSTAIRWGDNGTGYTYANWPAVTGLTNAGAFADTLPPNLVVVRPNAYEAGRANIVVYNWARLSTVSVDVSAVLSVGDRYVVQNVQDFYGTPASSGTYTGAPLQLPTAAIPAPSPIVHGVPGPVTGPNFNAFVLLKTP